MAAHCKPKASSRIVYIYLEWFADWCRYHSYYKITLQRNETKTLGEYLVYAIEAVRYLVIKQWVKCLHDRNKYNHCAKFGCARTTPTIDDNLYKFNGYIFAI